MRNSVLLAIDPGANGGLAWLDQHGLPHCTPMPDTAGDIVDQIMALKFGGEPLAVMEEVSGYAGNGHPGSGMFKFGRNFGVIEGVLMALGFRLLLVRPQKWQKHFSLGTSSSCCGKTEWKNKLKAEAQRRFPSIKVTLATADALLILDYATN